MAQGKSVVPLTDVTLLPPITKPDKVACVGLNYRGHCEEQNVKAPVEPMIFSKFASTIVGPYDNIQLPKISNVSMKKKLFANRVELIFCFNWKEVGKKVKQNRSHKQYVLVSTNYKSF